MRIVLDTNVLIAAFAAHGLCESVYEACLLRHQIVLSEHILTELSRHLPRVLKVDADHADAIVALVRSQAEIVEPDDVPIGACHDADDLPVLGTLLAGAADVLATGDADLQAIGTFHGKPILSPRALYELIG